MLIIIPFVSVNSFAYSHPNEIYPGSQIQKCGNQDDFGINFIFLDDMFRHANLKKIYRRRVLRYSA